MTAFNTYFTLGVEHITDLQGYDHIVFLLALVAVYSFQDWKKVFWLVTAFTAGHTLTLILAALKIIPVPAELIEFLIPVTIFCTAIFNLLPSGDRFSRWKYALALSFGLIHGMGFSNFFRSLLGSQADITMPLFAFNVGVEAGQLIIVMLALSLSYLVILRFQWLNRREWNVFLSGAAAGISLLLMQDAAFWT